MKAILYRPLPGDPARLLDPGPHGERPPLASDTVDFTGKGRPIAGRPVVLHDEGDIDRGDYLVLHDGKRAIASGMDRLARAANDARQRVCMRRVHCVLETWPSDIEDCLSMATELASTLGGEAILVDIPPVEK